MKGINYTYVYQNEYLKYTQWRTVSCKMIDYAIYREKTYMQKILYILYMCVF